MAILVGFDESEGARDAVALVADLRQIADSEVLLVEVLGAEDRASTPHRVLSPERHPPQPDFAAAVAALPGAEVEARAVAGGSPARVLHEISAGEDVDLVVVGSPHRGALGRTFLGSVAASLLHGSPVPVAVAPRGYRGERHGRPRRIAVAYDGGPEAKLALAYARTLASSAGAAVRVLTVATPAVAMPGVGGYTPPLGPDSERFLAEARSALGAELETDGRQLAGAPAAALAEACEDGVDLLVAGSRGYGPLGRVFVGSVAAGLIAHAPCPVIVVPRDEEEE